MSIYFILMIVMETVLTQIQIMMESDQLEIIGCQDFLYMNYDSLATDPGICDLTWHECQQIVSTQIDSLVRN